jgi:hypothetical protein
MMMPVAGGGTSAALAGPCDSCNDGNDTLIADNPNTHDSKSTNDNGFAWQFTLAADSCITGYSVGADDNGGAVTITCYIYSDNAGEPNVSLGAGYSSTGPVGDANYGTFEVLLSSTQELSAGTYWAYCIQSATIDWGYGSSGGTYRRSTDGTNFYSSGTINAVIDVLGCSQ